MKDPEDLLLYFLGVFLVLFISLLLPLIISVWKLVLQ